MLYIFFLLFIFHFNDIIELYGGYHIHQRNFVGDGGGSNGNKLNFLFIVMINVCVHLYSKDGCVICCVVK
jgi:hypothetical protein